MTNKYYALLSLFIFLFISTVFSQEYRIHTFEQIKQKIFIGDIEFLEAGMFNGGIEIIADQDNLVKIKVIKRGSGYSEKDAKLDVENIDINMKKDGKKIIIAARYTKQPMNRPNSGASAIIHVPANVELKLNSSNGEIKVMGPVQTVYAETSNEAIVIKGAKGALTLQTSNGEIDVHGGKGTITAVTSNSAVSIKSQQAVISAQTTNDTILFSGRLAAGNNEFITQNGGITIALPKQTNFKLDAATSNGSINSESSFFRVDEKGQDTLIATTHQNPGVKIKCKTSNSDVEIVENKQ